MAPEIAFEALKGLPRGSTILDPMAGSGTVLKTISEKGFNGLGYDIDPLAVLMTKAWTSNIEAEKFLKRSNEIVQEAHELRLPDIHLPWIDDDPETKAFINFWFGRRQINSLRKLSFLLSNTKGPYSDLCKIALSRIIITKTNGASLAADISHSRPHKVKETNDFDVLLNYGRSCDRLAKFFPSVKELDTVKVYQGDARKLKKIDDHSVDAIVTSPPYLNALDYMRGHKMSLVWLGHSISELSHIRSVNVGAEKAPEKSHDKNLISEITKGLDGVKQLPSRKLKMVQRYAVDMHKVLGECYRVLEKKGRATFVVGNSCVDGVYIQNSKIINRAADIHGFTLKERTWRKIPENRRYLPPPNNDEKSSLGKRMRTEVILTFNK